MVAAIKSGTETVVVEGHAHDCEIVDVTYDSSLDYRPHSKTEHHHLWIDPKDLIVLRETAPADETEWTADVTFVSFDRPVSAQTLKDLEDLHKKPTDRQDWVGRPLPNLRVEPLSGPSFDLADLRGKLVLLDFWGRYCPPCKSATLYVQKLAERYKLAGLTVVTFTKDNADDARAWAAHNGVTLPIVLDRDGGAFSSFEIDGIPEVVLAGADGKIIHFWVGFEDPVAMDTILQEALNRSATAPTR